MDGRIDGLMDQKKNILYHDSRTGTSKAAIALISHFTGIFISCFIPKTASIFLANPYYHTERPLSCPCSSPYNNTQNRHENKEHVCLLTSPFSSSQGPPFFIVPLTPTIPLLSPIPIHSIKTLFNSSTTLPALFKPLPRSPLSTIFLIQQQQQQHHHQQQQQQHQPNKPTTNQQPTKMSSNFSITPILIASLGFAFIIVVVAGTGKLYDIYRRRRRGRIQQRPEQRQRYQTAPADANTSSPADWTPTPSYNTASAPLRIPLPIASTKGPSRWARGNGGGGGRSNYKKIQNLRASVNDEEEEWEEVELRDLEMGR